MPLPLAPERFLLSAGLAAGVLLAAIFPPFAQPDEPVHFFRAYSLATGRLTGVRTASGFGASLPRSLVALRRQLQHRVPLERQSRVEPAEILAAFARPLAPEDRVFVDFRNASVVSPLPYLPQATAIGFGLLLGAPPLALFYLGRIANLVAALLVVAWAIRMAPAYRWLLALLAVTPMTLSLFASMSADALTIGTAWLATAAVARLAFTEGEANRRGLAVMTAATAALCLTKLVYAPLALFPLLVPARRFPGGRRWRALAVHGAVVVAALALSGYLAWRMDLSVRPGADVDRSAQIEGALADPLQTAAVVIRDLAVHAPRYGIEALGSRLGWLDVPVPLALLAVHLTVLLALLATDGGAAPKVGVGSRLALVGLAAASAVLVIASEYAIWTPVGAAFVEGGQGRYFLPLAFAAGWALHRRSVAAVAGWRRPDRWAAAWGVAVALATVVVVAVDFYG